MMTYKVIYSKRKTVSLSVDKNCEVIVKAPYFVSKGEIEAFVRKHEDWIRRKLAEMESAREAADNAGKYTYDEINALGRKALDVIPGRVEYYAQKLGVTYGRITIRCQKSRWGSCSSKGNLNFNCLLMEMPSEVLDSVVVHELCHRLEMNHSEKFYDHILSVFPEYYKWNKWLKENGKEYMLRIPW